MTTPKLNKDAMGKGIRSLLQNIDADLKTTSGQLKSNVIEAATSTLRIPFDQIETNPKQPRYDFDEQSMNELVNSIKLHDIIQPITVSKLPSGKFRLISGERRLRAARLAGLADLPAYVRQADDQQLLELALLENLQREDLNAIEIALSYRANLHHWATQRLGNGIAEQDHSRDRVRHFEVNQMVGMKERVQWAVPHLVQAQVVLLLGIGMLR